MGPVKQQPILSTGLLVALIAGCHSAGRSAARVGQIPLVGMNASHAANHDSAMQPTREKGGASPVDQAGVSRGRPDIPSVAPAAVPPLAVAAATTAEGALPGGEGQQRPATDATGLDARTIIEKARKFYREHPQYTCRVTRQEVVSGKLLPRESMLMNFRREPCSVHYKWLDDANAGRECVFVEGSNDGQIVSLGGKGDLLLVGRRMKVDPQGFMARSRGRYSIRESGIHKMVDRLESTLTAIERGVDNRGAIRATGTTKQDDLDELAVELVQSIPVNADPMFPAGATRRWYFEPQSGRLLKMAALGPKGDLLEYYRFDRFIPNPMLSDADFSPDLIWHKGRPRDSVAGAGKPGPTAPAAGPIASGKNDLPK